MGGICETKSIETPYNYKFVSKDYSEKQEITEADIRAAFLKISFLECVNSDKEDSYKANNSFYNKLKIVTGEEKEVNKLYETYSIEKENACVANKRKGSSTVKKKVIKRVKRK